MPGFHELPEEIAVDIIEFIAGINPKGDCIGSKELCQLRLVSKPFNDLALPLLFSTLRLEFKGEIFEHYTPPDFLRCQEIIKALATRSTTVFGHTKRLYLHPERVYWFQKLTGAEILHLDHIFDAICALKNLHTIHWVPYSEYCQREIAVRVIDALATLPSFQGFEDLHFRVQPPPSFTLQPLSNLTIFRTQWDWRRPEDYFFPEITSLLSRCPDIDEISFNGPRADRSAPSLLEILPPIRQLKKPWKLRKLELKNVKVTPDDIRTYIQHLKYLTFLGILENPDPKARTIFGDICNILRQNDIVLRDVLTDLPEDPLLLSHLSSFSGMTSLRLEVSPAEYDNPEVTNQIYMEVLPKHAETLECLEMGWNRLPTNEQLAELIKCQKLTRLQVCCSLSNEKIIQGDVSIYEMWLDVGLQLPNLTHLRLLLTARGLSVDLPMVFKILSDLQGKYRRERRMKFRVNDFWYV